MVTAFLCAVESACHDDGHLQHRQRRTTDGHRASPPEFRPQIGVASAADHAEPAPAGSCIREERSWTNAAGPQRKVHLLLKGRAAAVTPCNQSAIKPFERMTSSLGVDKLTITIMAIVGRPAEIALVLLARPHSLRVQISLSTLAGASMGIETA